jgi:hypothetical protein
MSEILKTTFLPFVPPLYPTAPPSEPLPPTNPMVLARALSRPLPPIVVAEVLLRDSGSESP